MSGAGEMSQQVKVLAAKPDCLSSNLRIYMVEEGLIQSPCRHTDTK